MNELSLKAIVKTFGATMVLDKISLDFSCGSVTAIVGDNGAGKSTLCKTIAGVYHPEAGTVTLSGERLDRLGPHETRKAGVEMVYQDLALAKQHDVVSNLFFGREQTTRWGFLNRKSMQVASAEVLGRLGITLRSLELPVGLLSGGQQQAVAIARALIFSPKVLIMDEPTAALAAQEIEHIIELIKKLKEHGLVIILISHRLNDVFAVSDRIVTLRGGCVVADNPTSKLSMQDVVSQIVGA
jgi:ABC-type sugar transport system ATPase subunit